MGRYAGALCACVMCLAVYMCILSFSFPDCSLLDGREVSGAGGGEGKEEEISVGELTVSNLGVRDKGLATPVSGTWWDAP